MHLFFDCVAPKEMWRNIAPVTAIALPVTYERFACR
jgi:hypothetical protein